jgi:hypothetical protein
MEGNPGERKGRGYILRVPPSFPFHFPLSVDGSPEQAKTSGAGCSSGLSARSEVRTVIWNVPPVERVDLQ